jgi:cytochrome c oxidase cbb3-type subunit 2
MTLSHFLNVLEEQPVLIGNRRQGPDLSNVGARRSAAWLKAHFIEPRTLVPNSAMPSYAHLFTDRRGDDLVSYLSESGRGRIENVREIAGRWKPDVTNPREDGKALFSTHCTACHGAGGLGDGPLAKRFSKPPANLTKGPFLWTPAGEDLETRVARVIKFGVPGTDMPGHEVMTDGQIMALKDEVLQLRKNPIGK